MPISKFESEYKSNFDRGIVWCCFENVRKEPKRNTVQYFCKVLCAVILPRFDDFSKEYKCVPRLKGCASFEEALNNAFEIEPDKIKEVLVRLKQFKNQDPTFVECMACAKKIK